MFNMTSEMYRAALCICRDGERHKMTPEEVGCMLWDVLGIERDALTDYRAQRLAQSWAATGARTGAVTGRVA